MLKYKLNISVKNKDGVVAKKFSCLNNNYCCPLEFDIGSDGIICYKKSYDPLEPWVTIKIGKIIDVKENDTYIIIETLKYYFTLYKEEYINIRDNKYD